MLTNNHIRSLEQLHRFFLDARLRKRKKLPIHPDEFEAFEIALKETLNQIDPQE